MCCEESNFYFFFFFFEVLLNSVERKIDNNRKTEPLLWKDDLQFQGRERNIRSQKSILKFLKSKAESEHVMFAAARV